MGLEEQLNKGKEAVLESGRIILEIYDNKEFDIEYKEDGSPVTKADKVAERKIREVILSAFPSNGFVGEEFEEIKGDDYTWYCDPIDGTWCVINGEKTASTSLALSYCDKTVLSIVYNPFRDELFSGADGIQTTLNNKPLPIFSQQEPKDAVYNFQISRDRKDDVVCLYDLYKQIKIGKLISTGGSVAYNLAQVSEGHHSVYIATSNKPSNLWDILGGIYLVESVGGEISQMDNGRILVASTNPIIHEKTRELLKIVNFGNIRGLYEK